MWSSRLFAFVRHVLNAGPMLDFLNPQELTFEEVKTLTHAMFAVAKADGVHDLEMRLIREFYESCSRAGDPPLSEVAGGPFDIQEAKALFESPEKAQLFIKTLILLAFADGHYAKVEDQLIRGYADALGLAPAVVDGLHESTKEYLLQSLSHVQNLEALKEVRKRLDPQ